MHLAWDNESRESTNSTRETFIAAPMLIVAGGWNSWLSERSRAVVHPEGIHYAHARSALRVASTPT